MGYLNLSLGGESLFTGNHWMIVTQMPLQPLLLSFIDQKSSHPSGRRLALILGNHLVEFKAMLNKARVSTIACLMFFPKR